jgi:Raf kinase inhibitor-like YbhB/YbcL family protein
VRRPLVLARLVIIATVAALLIAALAEPVGAKSSFRLTSPAFKSGGTIPEGFTCDGANASPPLRWKGVPNKTKELALIVDDQDVPRPGGFVHWVAWGIDPGARQLPEQTLPAGIVEGNTGRGRPGYVGPCPPPGADPHRYRFTLYALSKRVAAAAGATADELRTAIKGSVLAKTRLVGRYARLAGMVT